MALVALEELFTSGGDGLVPQGDAARQAVDSLRGYAYQITAAALAWLDLDESGRLFLEVAEDYAIVARNAIKAVQVKDTLASGTVKLNTESVRDAVSDFVSLRAGNPSLNVQLRYLTTSEIGTEKMMADRPDGVAGLLYWRKAAMGADVRPLRTLLEREKFSASVRKFVEERDDEALRKDLLRNIHWDCGNPSLAVLRREFEERLVLIGRDVFQLPAPEAARIADVLIYHVLEKSVTKNPNERFLTRAELYRCVDQATRIFVPRAAADKMALIASGLTTSAFASFGVGLPVAFAEPGWLIDGKSLPVLRRMLPREAIQVAIVDRVRRFGACVVVGASGLGKSFVARAAAGKLGAEFVRIEFRGVDAEETRSRLDAVFSRIGGLRPLTVIFEDLNHFSDPLVTQSIARVFEALRRRDRVVIATCYLSPTAKALYEAGLDAVCSIECQYFTEEEARELVLLNAGDPELWGRLAYVAGGFGHPQLVHAFVAGSAARGWPESEIREIVDRGLASGDVEAECDAARRSLLSAIPQSARNLLYRLSLTMGRFDRAMAVTIGAARPPITQAGEYLDALIGPWVETVGPDQYRISPLAARSGQGMLSLAERTGIHNAIAAQFLAKGSISGGDIDVIIMHAMLGKNDGVLFRLAQSVLTSDELTLGRLANNLTTFKFFRADRTIYPGNALLSVLLRLAQFRLLDAAQEIDKIGACASALLSEVEHQENEVGHALRSMAFAAVLGTKGIANYLDDWLDLLQQFKAMTEADDLLRRLRDDFESKDQVSLYAVLFAIGSIAISTVARLEHVINQLDQIEPTLRSLYLSAIAEGSSDYSVFINGPWSSEHQRDAVNATDAVTRYARMANKTMEWGIRPITLQCWVAQAVMLDEYAEDREGALQILDNAVDALGDDIRLSRARAKIYWRAQDHERALSILRRIADKFGLDNHIERAFALREAAISAAKCGEWPQAETWFWDSKEAAAISDLPDMTIMAVGLAADTAVAALQAGDVERALRLLGDALTELAGIDAASSLRAYYCHQVVRHAVLWTQAYIEKSKVEINGSPIAIEPGACSNPEPPQAIADRPLGPLDYAWYMLAQAEVSSGRNVRAVDSLYDRLDGGPILVMEVDLRERQMTRDITNLNADGFASHLWSYVEATAHLLSRAEQLRSSFNAFKPMREDILPVPRSDLSDPFISGIAEQAVVAYGIAVACVSSKEALSDLEAKLRSEFGDNIPGKQMLARANATTQLPLASSFDEALFDAIRLLKNREYISPNDCCVAAIRFFQHGNQSYLKRYLIPVIAAWQRQAWTRIVVSETFRLSRPMQTVPEIKAALSVFDDNEAFLGALFLAAAMATGTILPQDMHDEFQSLAMARG